MARDFQANDWWDVFTGASLPLLTLLQYLKYQSFKKIAECLWEPDCKATFPIIMGVTGLSKCEFGLSQSNGTINLKGRIPLC